MCVFFTLDSKLPESEGYVWFVLFFPTEHSIAFNTADISQIVQNSRELKFLLWNYNYPKCESEKSYEFQKACETLSQAIETFFSAEVIRALTLQMNIMVIREEATVSGRIPLNQRINTGSFFVKWKSPSNTFIF